MDYEEFRKKYDEIPPDYVKFVTFKGGEFAFDTYNYDEELNRLTFHIDDGVYIYYSGELFLAEANSLYYSERYRRYKV